MLEIRTYLEQLGQPHLGLNIESLSPSERHAFREQLTRYGPKTLARQRALLAAPVSNTLDSYSPLSHVESGLLSDQKRGDALIREGKVGCLILAGGQGTRLGYDGPKGIVPITAVKRKSLFQFHAERAVCASKKAQQLLPIAIMTSPINHDQTLSFFEKQDFFGLHPSQLTFFPQGMLPLLDAQGHWLLERPGSLAVGPDGNGLALHCFYEQGIWDLWRKKGVEYLNVIFVDNPLADPFDGTFIGFTDAKDLDVGLKVVERISLSEKMGVIAKAQNKIKVVEYSEFSPMASAEYLFANTGLLCWSMEFIRKLCQDKTKQLPLHVAHKQASAIPIGSTIAEQVSVCKCETFQFDLLDFTEKSAAMLCPRQSTYAPVKNAQGEKSPASAKEALLAWDKQIYSQLSGLTAPAFAFELDPAFYYPTEAIKKAMRECVLPGSGYITPEILNLLPN